MKPIQYWCFDFVENDYKSLYSDESIDSIDTLSKSFLNGVYTTLRTRQSKFALVLEAHLIRLVDGFRLNGFDFPYDINQLRAPLRSILHELPEDEHRVRLHIPFQEPYTCYIVIEPLIPYPKKYYEQGVAVKTNHLLRNNPLAKQSTFIELSQTEKELVKRENLEESLILNDSGEILEGLTSNFFAIKAGAVFTASQTVLSGITRAILLEAAEKGGFKVLFTPIVYNDISKIDEAFITSTSRNVMPVIQIDSALVGEGMPGPITKILMNLFQVAFDDKFEII